MVQQIDSRSNPPLSLSRALAEGRLADFITQEEARSVGPASREALDAALRAASAPSCHDAANVTSQKPAVTARQKAKSKPPPNKGASVR